MKIREITDWNKKDENGWRPLHERIMDELMVSPHVCNQSSRVLPGH